jgi:putative DNA primase/helicase
MSFEQFAEQHGLIIDHLLLDRWVRCPTIDHPNKKNGSYIYDGNSGAVQNWAVHEKPISYRGKHDPEYRSKITKARVDRKQENEQAASKAGYLMKLCTRQTHPYFKSKGFPELKADVWNGTLMIPMRIDQKIVGIQMIRQDGGKNFMKGQVTKGAEFVMDGKGVDILCEGFATGLSIRRALKAVKTRYTIHVCFSAANLKVMAIKYPDCFIVADHDAVGIRIAKETERPFWVSPNLGEDFNDYELRVGSAVSGKDLVQFIGG